MLKLSMHVLTDLSEDRGPDDDAGRRSLDEESFAVVVVGSLFNF